MLVAHFTPDGLWSAGVLLGTGFIVGGLWVWTLFSSGCRQLQRRVDELTESNGRLRAGRYRLCQQVSRQAVELKKLRRVHDRFSDQTPA